MEKILNHPFFIRLLHWEYWPFHVVYALLYPYWIWLCLKARSFFFFSAANPSLENGGFLMESKKGIYDLIPQRFYPRTLFFSAGTAPETVLRKIQLEEFQYPLVGKPDIGLRGMAVKKLGDPEELAQYISSSKVNFLVQEFCSYELEAGVFYYRLPNERRGRVSGIVLKEFLTVTGDGRSTVLELLAKDQRSILQINNLKRMEPALLKEVLPENEKKVLVPYGNHCRGAKFVDASHRIDQKLTAVIDAVSREIDGFYYGRMDVRFESWESLKEGKNFSIIELNGAGSEPTHIYDPQHSLFFAWREIIRHWNFLYRISRQNRSRAPYMTFGSGVKMFRDNFGYLKLLNG